LYSPPPLPPGNVPLASGWSQPSPYASALSRLRTASILTLVGGSLLLLISFFLAVFAAVLDTGLTGALWVLTFGVAPAFVILAAGSKMQSPRASVDAWASIAIVAAALSLLTSGGFLVGALLTFVGAALARSAAHSLPPGAGFTVPSAQPPTLAPGYGPYTRPSPTYAPPPPPPLPYGPPMGIARPAAPPAAPYSAPAAYGNPGPSPAAAVLALQDRALELHRRGVPLPEIAAQLNLTPNTAAWLVSSPPAGAANPPPPPASVPPPPVPQQPPESSDASRPAPAAPAPAYRPRHSASPLHPADRFLQMDGDRAFDLEGLNALDFAAIRARASASREEADALLRKADEIIGRLRRDLSDINTIDDILRDRVVLWYTASAGNAKWPHPDIPPWSGLLSESHDPGGSRTPSLINRLLKLRDDITPPPLRPVRNFIQSLREEGPEKPPTEEASLAARVVQAVLDDIADTPRAPGAALQLHALSELAIAASPAAVNRALADLFKGDPKGPAIIIHPARYPNLEFVLVRLPPGGAAGAAVTYELVCAAPEALRSSAAASPTLGAAAPAASYSISGSSVDLSGNLWERDSIPPSAWAEILAELERRRDRLPPPPPNYRKLTAYFDLRKLLLDSPDARRTFLAVKWRGKPPALALLALLLTDRKLTPDVDTDCEYLEAELGDIERGDANWSPPAAKWTLPGGRTVTRAAADGLRTYAVA